MADEKPGLKDGEHEQIERIRLEIFDLIVMVEALGKHRSYSLAITKLEEAAHWMRDRLEKEA